MGVLKNVGALVAIGAVLIAIFPPPDVLSGLSSNHDHGPLEIQAIMTAFCLSPIIGTLLGEREGIDTTGGDFKFEDDGDIENDEYAQASIYAILYAMYKNTPNLISPHGKTYRKLNVPHFWSLHDFFPHENRSSGQNKPKHSPLAPPAPLPPPPS